LAKNIDLLVPADQNFELLNLQSAGRIIGRPPHFLRGRDVELRLIHHLQVSLHRRQHIPGNHFIGYSHINSKLLLATLFISHYQSSCFHLSFPSSCLGMPAHASVTTFTKRSFTSNSMPKWSFGMSEDYKSHHTIFKIVCVISSTVVTSLAAAVNACCASIKLIISSSRETPEIESRVNSSFSTVIA